MKRSLGDVAQSDPFGREIERRQLARRNGAWLQASRAGGFAGGPVGLAGGHRTEKTVRVALTAVAGVAALVAELGKRRQGDGHDDAERAFG